MTAAGLAKIETANQDGSWNKWDGIEELDVPPDLEAALADNKAAYDHFMAFSPSSRKNTLWWITSAAARDSRQADRRDREYQGQSLCQ